MPRFPRGTVTFVYATSTASHSWTAHLRTAISSHGGVLFFDSDTLLQAAFSAPLPALRAVLQAHRHIVAIDPELAHPALPTVALHTGRAAERTGVYAGPTINRVMSILAAAHPGQILLSASIHDALQDGLPPDVQLQPLGEYRLKDLLRTAQLYQVLTPGLPSSFPPLQTLDARPHNLPIQDSPLIGRELEVGATCTLLRNPASGLLTLLGSSGLGKTRLALQVAVELLDDFADGVYFVALAPVSDPDLLPSMIAQVLGVKEQAGQPLLATLTAFLQTRSMLLVLDNFEQLLAAAPALIELLDSAPKVKILVTSQVALGLESEQVFALPPLVMPDPTQPIQIDGLSQVPAVALFVERARDVQPTFSLTELNAPAVIELCIRLEGVPLALELVAAQSKRYFPGDMLVLLQNRLSMARTIRRGNTREDTLRPVLDWICEGLGAGVTGLFARLGVFAGGCTSESARAICNPTNDLALNVEQALMVLLENHLLLREELKEGHIRYTMLDAIHEYAQQRLTRRDKLAQIQHTHASYYTVLAEIADPLLKGSDQQIWITRLANEHHNLRAALHWALAIQPELALRLSGALWRFWYLHGHFTEGRQWLEVTLEQQHTDQAAPHATALHGLGGLSFVQGDYAAAIRAFERALALRRELDDRAGIAVLLNNLGMIAGQRGQYSESTTFYEESLIRYRELDDRWGVANTLMNLGQILFNQGDIERATACYTECMIAKEALGDTMGLALTLSNLGRVATEQRDYAHATTVLIQALSMAQQLGAEWIEAHILENQARLNQALGDLPAAHRLVIECLRIHQRLGAKYPLGVVLDVLAALMIAEGQPGAAPKLLGAAAALRQALDIPPIPVELINIKATAAAALAQMNQAAFDAAYQAGVTMPLDELLEQVYAVTPSPA